MKKIITLLLFGIFALSISIFTSFGKRIRDYYSAHVDVTNISERILSNGIYAQVLLSSCLYEDDDGSIYAYIVEEKTDSGERAYYSRKVEVITGVVDGEYTEIINVPDFNALFICSFTSDFTEGERVIIEKIVY
ncbi:MAG: hypothetical protein GX757_07700 [Clostridiales bacterium]|nr:hypothetical protein [Clostridiales bacterium]